MSSENLFVGDVQNITLGGRRFVILPESQFRRIQKAVERGNTAANFLPELPPADARGYYPALETMRILMASDIISSRNALGLSQAELARRAGIRPETLNRIEQGKHHASTATLEKIDRVLKAAESAAGASPKRVAGKRKHHGDQ